MLRLISTALLALSLLAGPALAQSFTLPELGLQNSGSCRQLAARDRSNGAMVALGCVDTGSHAWKPLGDASGMSVANVVLSTALGTSAITRAAIPTSLASAITSTIVTSGYTAAGDRGAACTYVRGSSTGPGAVQDGLGNWWQLAPGKPLDVSCFGAKMDGTTDDSAAVQAAANAAKLSGAGSQITIPGGSIRLCSVNLPTNTRVSGAGVNATAVFAGSSTCTVFGASDPSAIYNVSVDNLSFYASSSARQTSGAYVFFNNCIDCRLTAFKFSGAYIGAQVSGSNTTNVNIDHGRSNGASLYHFVVSGGSDTFLDKLLTTADSGAQATCGLLISQSGGTWLSDSDFVGSGHGTCLQPQSGQSVLWTFISNTALGDTGSGNGLFINPIGTGVVQSVNATGSWASSNTGAGFATQCSTSGGATGTVLGVYLTTPRAIANGQDGFSFGCGSDIRLYNPIASSNSNSAHGGTTGVSSGISFAPGLGHFTVIGGSSEPTNGDIVRQRYGVFVQGGASDYYTIRDFDSYGGTTAGVSVQDNGTGTHKTVTGNF